MAQPERHLAALFSADAVGYSRLLADNENATLETLRTHRAEIEQLVEQHQGRVLATPGDNILAEFPTATGAVECGLEVQEALATRNALLPAMRRMDFRIGIHLGEVRVDDDGQVHGDAINIAARLEGLADSGGVCVSREVRGQLRGKLPVDFEDLGDRELKNLPEPVGVYRLRVPNLPRTKEDKPASPSPLEAGAAGSRSRFAAGALGAAAILVVVLFWTIRSEDTSAPSIRSIAVLPLENLSGDPDQDYFAAGITEELVGALSNIGALRVPSGRSVLRYRGSTKPMPEIASELNVDALIEGSVRRQGDRVRITVQLVRGPTDEHLWSENYDEELRDILALQSRVARQVADLVEVTLTPGERTRLAKAAVVEPAGYDAYLKGRYEFTTQGPFVALEIIQILEHAVSLDPGLGKAHAWLANVYRYSSLYSILPATEAIPKVRAHAEKAIASGEGTGGYVELGWVAALFDWNWKEAKDLFSRGSGDTAYTRAKSARALSSWGPIGEGFLLCALGRWRAGLNHWQMGIRLDPFFPARASPTLGHEYSGLPFFAETLARTRNYDASVEVARWLTDSDPNRAHSYRALWLASWWKGEWEQAVRAGARFYELIGLDPTPLVRIYRESGFRAYVQAILESETRRASQTHVSPTWIASLYAYLDDPDRAFEWLNRAVQQKDSPVVIAFNMNPMFDPVRSDPRFADLAERVGIPLVEPDGPLVAPLPYRSNAGGHDF